MRVRVLNDPDIVRMLNERACCLDYNLVKDGFPFHLPVFQALEAAVLSTTWYRLNFALQMLLNAEGTRMFTAQYYEALAAINAQGHDKTFEPERLKSALDRHDQWLAAKRGDGDLDEIESVLDVRETREKAIFTEGRFWTAAFLGDRLNRWDFVSGLVDTRPAPGVRNSVIRALGELLIDETPLEINAAKALRTIYPDDFVEPVELSVGSKDVPNSVKVTAAQELERFTGATMNRDPETAAQWYRENKDKPNLQIVWSGDPRLKYAFSYPQDGFA